MARIIRARWVLPIDSLPIDGGWIEIVDGRIARVGRGKPSESHEDLGNVAVLPGLVNTHLHLELSWMAGKIPPSASMVDWIRSMIALRASGPSGGDSGRLDAMRDAARTLRAHGTALVGDISNTLTSAPVLRDAGLGGVVFHELLGFAIAQAAGLVSDAWKRVADAEDAMSAESSAPPIRFSVVAHAPYSVSPALFTEIARHTREEALSVHIAESGEEVRFVHDGTGPFRTLLEQLGVWRDEWQPPFCGPVEYLERLGYLQQGLLAVHGVHLRSDELGRLRRAGAVVVTCPRSNEWVGAGAPPVSRFYASGVAVAIGTDSLASSPSLSVFDELAELRRLAPEVAAASLLESATRVGADALGFSEFGTIAPGKRASLIAVQVPHGERDVEEYLVSGVPHDAISWAAG
jgi:cytosine/adenosine deaminase-related metal-dependent hydrolase